MMDFAVNSRRKLPKADDDEVQFTESLEIDKEDPLAGKSARIGYCEIII